MSSWIIVEDEESLYDMLLTMTELFGVEGVPFADGDTAVDWLDDVDEGLHAGQLPVLALVDMRLPGKFQGEMVGERIRKSKKLNHIAVVLMTAYRMTKEQEDAVITQAGADALVYKPLPRLRDFRRMLEAIIEKRGLNVPKE